MNELINELKICLDNKLYISALNTALLIPDICSALQSSNGRTDGKKYSNWFNDYVSEKYNGNLQGSDVYKIRCATLHQGTFNSDYKLFNLIVFQPTSQTGVFHNLISAFNGGDNRVALMLNLETFINDIIIGLGEWTIKMKENPFYEKNLKQSFKFCSSGLSPHFAGIPLFA